jgi:hypothetical protein
MPSTLLGAGALLDERLLELIRVVDAVEQHIPDPSLAAGSGDGVRGRRVRYRDELGLVFVVGVTDGVLPDSRSKSKEQLDEECRLLYVAVTRARQRVCLHHAPIWSRHARQTFTKESRFMTSKAVEAALQK